MAILALYPAWIHLLKFFIFFFLFCIGNSSIGLVVVILETFYKKLWTIWMCFSLFLWTILPCLNIYFFFFPFAGSWHKTPWITKQRWFEENMRGQFSWMDIFPRLWTGFLFEIYIKLLFLLIIQFSNSTPPVIIYNCITLVHYFRWNGWISNWPNCGHMLQM